MQTLEGRKQCGSRTDSWLGWGLEQKPWRRAMAPNTRLDSAFPTQGEAVNGSFAGSEASHWMVPSENNNRNQQNYCCKLTHFFFFLKTDSRFTSYSYITKDCTATELHFTANSPRIQSKLRKTEVLTLAQILVTKNKPETQELLHSYFFF